MFFLCSVFAVAKASSQCASDLLRLASLATTRYSFSFLYIFGTKLYDVVVFYVGFFFKWFLPYVWLFLLLGALFFAELLILLPCNNESYLLQIPKKKKGLLIFFNMHTHIYKQLCTGFMHGCKYEGKKSGFELTMTQMFFQVLFCFVYKKAKWVHVLAGPLSYKKKKEKKILLQPLNNKSISLFFCCCKEIYQEYDKNMIYANFTIALFVLMI